MGRKTESLATHFSRPCIALPGDWAAFIGSQGDPEKDLHHERYGHIVFDIDNSRLRVYWKGWESSEELEGVT